MVGIDGETSTDYVSAGSFGLENYTNVIFYDDDLLECAFFASVESITVVEDS